MALQLMVVMKDYHIYEKIQSVSESIVTNELLRSADSGWFVILLELSAVFDVIDHNIFRQHEQSATPLWESLNSREWGSCVW